MTESAKVVWGMWDHSMGVHGLNRLFYLFMDIMMKIRHFSEASGDFQLMRREHWNVIGGYAEAPTYGHFDSVLLYQWSLMGFKVHLLRAPVFIFHSMHEGGFHERVGKCSNPTYADLYQTKLKLNPPNWGLPDVRFREFEFQNGKRVDHSIEKVVAPEVEGLFVSLFFFFSRLKVMSEKGGTVRKILAEDLDAAEN
jgi:hypothetical protein